ncbi:MAG TPA: integrase arm-type DNA-binding domain-containing protein [Ramlibacter sp.]|jgi:integrase
MRASQINKLSARKVETVKDAGRHSDGGGLYLNVSATGSKSWVFMYNWNKRRVEIGLGSVRDMPLATARAKAQELREALALGIDPKTAKRASAAAAAAVLTFGELAEQFIKDNEAGWRNPKHVDQWRYTLSVRRDDSGAFLPNDGYCVSLRSKAPDQIGTEDILSILKPIWHEKPETARRMQGRIERVLDAAKARNLRNGENPARWKGHLDKLLTKKAKLKRGHHAAMPYAEVGTFLNTLMFNPSSSNLALAFTILTAARSGETMGATWAEIDLAAGTWTVPADRMKGNKIHVVPLPPTAQRILEIMATKRRNGFDFIFPGMRGKSGRLSVMALAMSMRRHKAGDYTVHGFRSAFRDWAGDETTFARDDIEQCLAHAIGNEVEKAYRRGTALDKRRTVMTAWDDYLSGREVENVTPIHRRQKSA